MRNEVSILSNPSLVLREGNAGEGNEVTESSNPSLVLREESFSPRRRALSYWGMGTLYSEREVAGMEWRQSPIPPFSMREDAGFFERKTPPVNCFLTWKRRWRSLFWGRKISMRPLGEGSIDRTKAKFFQKMGPFIRFFVRNVIFYGKKMKFCNKKVFFRQKICYIYSWTYQRGSFDLLFLRQRRVASHLK